MAPDRRRMAAAAAWVAVALPCVSGCAEMMLANNLAILLKAWPSTSSQGGEIGRVTFFHPAGEVFATLEREVEQGGFTLVEHDASAGSLRVTYPFSWLQNNRGGSLKITCIAGDSGTTVTVVGDGRDHPARVKVLADALLDEVNRALRRLPRAL